MDFMPYEGAPPKAGRDSERLFLALAIGAGIVAGAWRLGAFTPVSAGTWSESRTAPSATASANRDVASPELAKNPVAAH
jgi:hypothetical protein